MRREIGEAETELAGVEGVALHAGHANAAVRGLLQHVGVIFLGARVVGGKAAIEAGADARVVTLFHGITCGTQRRFEGDRSAVVDRAHAVADGEQGGSVQAHDALGFDIQRGALRRPPTQPASVAAGAQVEGALEIEPFAFAQSHRRIAQTQVDACAVGHRHPGIGMCRKAGKALVVFDRRTFPGPGEEAALARAVVLFEATAYAQVAVREGKQAFVLGERGAMGLAADQQPGVAGPAARRRHDRRRFMVIHTLSPGTLSAFMGSPRCRGCPALEVGGSLQQMLSISRYR